MAISLISSSNDDLARFIEPVNYERSASPSSDLSQGDVTDCAVRMETFDQLKQRYQNRRRSDTLADLHETVLISSAEKTNTEVLKSNLATIKEEAVDKRLPVYSIAIPTEVNNVFDENCAKTIPALPLTLLGTSLYHISNNIEDYIQERVVGIGVEHVISDIQDRGVDLKRLLQESSEETRVEELLSAIDEVVEDIEFFYERVGQLSNRLVREFSFLLNSLVYRLKNLVSNSTGLPISMISPHTFTFSLEIYNTQEVRSEISQLINIIDQINADTKLQKLFESIRPAFNELVISWQKKWGGLIEELKMEGRSSLYQNKIRIQILDLYQRCLTIGDFIYSREPLELLSEQKKQLIDIDEALNRSAVTVDLAIEQRLIDIVDIFTLAREVFKRNKR